MLHSRSIPVFASFSLLGAALLCGGSLQAQNEPLERAAVRPGHVPAAQLTPGQLPPVTRLVPHFTGAPTDDQPDFAPMEEYDSPDGRHRLLRPKGNPYVLSFTAGDYTPEPGIDPAMLHKQKQDPTGSTYGYIMLRGRMADAKIDALRKLGVTVLDYHTWQSVVARIPLTALAQLGRLPFVHWVGYPRAEQKIAPRLARMLAAEIEGNADQNPRYHVYVNLYASDMTADATRTEIGKRDDRRPGALALPATTVMPNGPVQRALQALGFQPDAYDASVFTFRGHATKAQIEALRALDVVRVIEAVQVHRSFHDQAVAMIGQDRVRKTYPGSKVPVGVIDTGLDLKPMHKDFGGKGFLGWKSSSLLPDVFDDNHGHGTHVAGTIFGRGIADKRYTGCAPSVGNGGEGDRIFIGRYLGSDGSSKGLAKTLYDIFAKSYLNNGKVNLKPAVVNNSWGAESSTGYKGTGYSSRTVDNTVYDHNQTYVFAAGNVDEKPGFWCSEPGCAKNVLTVGALSDHWGSGQIPGKAASFTRYNTKDGRRKPEVSAPGNVHTSTKSNTTTGYSNKSGTSMASPTVAGALVSLIDRDGGFRYWPPAVKAATVGCATLDGGLGVESRRGYGLVNSYKMNVANKTTYQVFTGTLTKTGQVLQGDLKIPSNAKAVRVVLNWTEPAASATAGQARRNDLRLYMDLPPYSSAGNSGEFSNSSSADNLIVRSSHVATNGGFCKSALGKTVRFKAYGQSIKSGDTAKLAIAVVIYYRIPTHSLKPTLTTTPHLKAVRPAGNLFVDAKLTAHPDADDLNDVRMWFSSPSSWGVESIKRITADSITQSYNKTNNHPSANYPRVGFGSGSGMTLGQGHSRNVQFWLRSPAQEGSHMLWFRAQYHATGDSVWGNTTVCVDNQNPLAATSLTSSTHSVNKWTNKNKITFTWNKIKDAGCAGIDRQYFTTSKGNPVTPTIGSSSISPNSESLQVTLPTSSQGQYFSIRGKDQVLLWGPTVSRGPYLIDAVKPLITKVTINDGAAVLKNKTVLLKVFGIDAASGIDELSFSMDNKTWSNWSSYTPAGYQFSIDATYLGGSTQTGVRYVYARLRDKAGNVSLMKSDSILYQPVPKLTKATIAALPSVNSKYYRIEGTDLGDITSIEFAGKTVTTKYTITHDSYWKNGSFLVLGTTILYFYPPQGLKPGSYPVKVKTANDTSNTLTLTVERNRTQVIRSSRNSLVSSLQTIMVTQGQQPNGSGHIIMASLSNKPSVLPGLYDFKIGNNFTNYVLLPKLAFNADGNSSIAFPVLRSFKGLKAYFQAGYLNPAPQTWPMPTSDLWATTYK